MAFGMIVYNSGGLVQIDDTYGGFRLWTSGSIAVPRTSTSSNGYATVNFTNSGWPPLVTIGDTGGHYVGVDNVTNSSVTFRGGAVATTIQYRIYVRTVGAASGEAHGLRIWAGNGNLVFDSGFRYYAVKSINNFNSNQLNPNYSSTTNPPANIGISHALGQAFVAIGQSITTCGVTTGPMGPIFFHHTIIRNSTNYVELTAGTIPTGVPPDMPVTNKYNLQRQILLGT